MAKLISITDGNVSASIDPMGAQLMNLGLGGNEYLWQGDPAFWNRRSPVLFPIVGVLRDGRATSAQGEVVLPRHGCARDFEHNIVEQDSSHVVFELDANEKTRAAFPYDFRLNMGYEVREGALYQSYTVTNTGEVDLPFTFGAHPAFNVPLCGSDESYSDYELRFDQAWTAVVPTVLENGLHDFDKMHTLFEDADRWTLSHEKIDELLTIVMKDVPGDKVTLVGTKSGHGVEVSFPVFDYLGVWTASAEAPFVAIEPWHGCADCLDESGVFEQKRDTIVLAPGEKCTHTFSMRPF